MNREKLFIAFALFVAGAMTIWWITGSPMQENDFAAPIVEIKVPELSEEARTGEQLFIENCAACHGNNAVGKNGIGPPLVHILYETSHHGDAAFRLAVQKGVRGHHWSFGNMPPVEGVSEEQIRLITRYVRELQRANGIK